VIALIRYSLAVVLHSQRQLAPLLLFTGLLAVLTVNGSGALPPAYASSAGALFLASTWLTVALLGLDGPSQRAVVTVSAGRPWKVLAGSTATVLLGCLPLVLLGLLLPLWVGAYRVRPVDLLLGVVAQLVCAVTGTAIGLLCSRSVFRRPGYGLVAALTLVLTVLFTPELPPVNRLFRRMADSADSAALLAPAFGMLALSVVLLAFAGAVAHLVAARRD
jgi:hypothetical protein